MNVLQLVQQACYSSNILNVPTTLVAPASASDLQLVNLFYSLCRELRAKRYWPQLKKKWTFQLANNQQTYQLPQDFFCYLPSTGWDVNNRWELLGPMTDREWNYRLYGWITTENRTSYRVFGPDSNPNDSAMGQFFVNPTPGTAIAGHFLSYEYISKTYITPKNWIPATAYTTADYVTVSGQIYKCSSNGTSAALGVAPPNMFNGQGQDGGVSWSYVATTAWGASTYYSYNDYVTHGGQYYVCTVPGQSGGTGPVRTTAGTETDGTVTWTFVTQAAWIGETQYTSGSYVTSHSNLYLSTNLSNYQQSTNVNQSSGKLAPNWTATTVVDGTATWTWQAVPYDTILADADLCLFDDDVMIDGLRWKFMQARGMEYEDLQSAWTEKVDEAVTRWMSGRRLSLANTDVMLAGLSPRIPEGNYGN